MSLTTLQVHLQPKRRHVYTVHQPKDARPDCLHLRRHIRTGCSGRRGDGILYWPVQLPASLRYHLRNARGRASSRSSFSSGTSRCPFRQTRAPFNYHLTVGCRAHTMLIRKNVVSVFRMVKFWYLHWRTSLFFSVALNSDVSTGVGRSHMPLC